jgi:anti-sigma factor RsiW
MTTAPPPSSPWPVTEAELHAHLDGQLSPERDREVRDWLAQRPAEAQRMAAYRSQQDRLRALFSPTLNEPLPPRLYAAATSPQRRRWAWQAAAALLLTLAGAAVGWQLHGWQSGRHDNPVLRLAERAAVAHVVYAPDRRRPVEVDGAHEEQLVAWLSKRMGTTVRAPHLQERGYTLEGGRLLPGERAPVAQFMYADAQGSRLTLYISNEPTAPAGTGFQFARHGAVNVFYWVDGTFGYALTSTAERPELADLAGEVHRQLTVPG